MGAVVCGGPEGAGVLCEEEPDAEARADNGASDDVDDGEHATSPKAAARAIEPRPRCDSQRVTSQSEIGITVRNALISHQTENGHLLAAR